MLTILLALAVGLGSFALYMSAFFYPEVYRKGDLIWSGVGLFYALVLLVCADRITGGVLLGQMASVSLIGWFGWQTLTGRLGYTPTWAEVQGKIAEGLKPENRSQMIAQAKQQFAGVREQVQTLIGKAPTAPAAEESYKPLTREDFGNPPVTVDASGEPAAKTDIKGAVANAGKAFSGLFKKSEKNTSTYVRKSFRDGEPEGEVAATEPVTLSQDPESPVTANEVIQEEIAYEAAKPDAVEPAEKPAEKPAEPPAEADAKPADSDQPENS